MRPSPIVEISSKYFTWYLFLKPVLVLQLVLVVVVPLVADRVAEAEGEYDSEQLHGDDPDDNADDDVEAADQVVVHGLVAALKVVNR